MAMIIEIDRYDGSAEGVRKSPGRIAYDADCSARPTYNDNAPRKAWHELSDVARDSWERNPTPRW